MKYVKLLFLFTAYSCLVFTSCVNRKKKEEEPPDYQRKEKSIDDTPREIVTVPVMLDNKGIGPVESLVFDDEIDEALANRGAAIFKAKCTTCHKANQRFMGPPMAGIYKKRSPEWVMNMILNPTEMLEKDPVGKALLKEYKNNIPMMDQKIPEEEARAMAEWFRTLD